MKRIVLAGGTGNIGKSLTVFLIQLGYHVILLSRKAKVSDHPQLSCVQWDGQTLAEWKEALEDTDALINLSGKNVQCRFTEVNKAELYQSRIVPTQILGEAIQTLKSPPRLWINFSGISIFEGVQILNNESSKTYGEGFLAELTKSWEQAFQGIDTPSTQKVCLRISPVLSKKYGLFTELYPLVKFGLGGKVGHARQVISWIHEFDLIRLVIWILGKDNPSPIYHACTPNPVTNRNFMAVFREIVGISFGLPLPAIVAKIGAYFKGVESSMLLNTNNVSTTQTVDDGFRFMYPTIKEALTLLIKK